MSDDPIQSPKFLAAVKLIERTGASSFRIGYSDEEDGPPTVWYATGVWPGSRGEAAAALNPLDAVLRLCEQVVDGGLCTHCGKPSIFDPDPPDELIDNLLDEMGCRYRWLPEREEFVRGCAE